MRMCKYLTFCLIDVPLQTHHCRGKRLQQVVALSPGEAILRAVGSSVMVMPYAVTPKYMCKNKNKHQI
jgi:hypothetical protein